MDRFDVMWEPVRAFLVQVGEFFPKVMLALVILLLGWLIAKAVRFAVVKALRAINFNVLTEKAGIDAFLKQGGGETDTTDILGLLIYWLTILTALMIASNSVGLIAVTELVVRVVLFVPKVIVAIVILAFGAYFARFIGMSVTAYCKSLDMPDAALFGRRGVFKKKVRRAVSGHHACFMWNTQLRESFRRVLQRFPIGRRTHDNADQRRLR